MLSQEDKEKCVKLYYWAAKKDSAAQDWNEEAANLLAELYAEMAKCSSAIDFIPRPPSSKPGLGYLLTYVYQALKAKMSGNSGIYEMCRTIRAAQYITHIEIALSTGN